MAYNAEKLLRENKDKISEELQEEINTKVTTLRAAIQEGDTSTISTAMTDLQSSVQKVGEAVYSQAGQEAPTDEEGQGPEQPEDEEKPPEDTVEGEFREV